ncbi:hypothetical protein DL93DRAFT_2167809 [Clavulina sp. PMI_390]|nr:hypothetical protein DL93DRAFT_2167809 [Clavulina sp. PMI_390]
MFSSPAPARRLHASRTGIQAANTFKERRKSAASSSNSATPVPQPLEQKLPGREFAPEIPSDVYSSRPEYTVSLLSTFPRELQQILSSYDTSRYPSLGLVDSVTGFAVLSLRNETFVWDYSSDRKRAGLSCFIFSNPPTTSTNTNIQTPLAALVPYRNSSEPGLLLCSQDGSIRFWENVSLGLAGGDSFRTLKLAVAVGEHITRVLRAGPTMFVFSTTHGRLFKVSLVSNSSQRTLQSSVVTDNRTIFSRVTSTFFAPASAPAQTMARMIVACDEQNDQRQQAVWAVSSTQIHRWLLAPDSWDEITWDGSLHDLLSSFSSKELGIEITAAHLRAHDVAASGDLITLICSYQRGISSKARHFCAVQLRWSDRALVVNSLRQLHGEFDIDDTFPLVKMVHGASAALVCFKDGILLQSLSQGSIFQSTLRFKSETNLIVAADSNSDGNFIISTFESGILVCELHTNDVHQSNSDLSSDHLRATLEQEVFFGSRPNNPLLFQLDTQHGGRVGIAAERLSQDIIQSHSQALSTLSEECKQRLWLDANRLMVGQSLWDYYNRSASAAPARATILKQAIEALVNRLGVPLADDALPRMEGLFEEFRLLVERTQVSSNPRHRLEISMEVSQILIIMWSASEAHRQANLEVYGIGPRILVPAWGVGDAQFRLAQLLLDEIVTGLEGFATGDIHDGPKQEDAENCLRDIASVTLSMWDAAGDYIASTRPDEDNVAELEAFNRQFSAVRTQILQSLVRWGGWNVAFDLADQYHEYRFLVELCVNPEFGGHQQVVHYLRKYREAFAFHLYKWPISRFARAYSGIPPAGQSRDLLEPTVEFLPLVEAFFSTDQHPRLEWVHDLSPPISKFAAAKDALTSASLSESRKDDKHVMLSLAKLSGLSTLDTFDDLSMFQGLNSALDMISVHTTVLNELQEVVDNSDPRTAEPTDHILRGCMASQSRDEAILFKLFKTLAKRLMAGQALDAEDLVELLTMKDTGSRSNDLATALLVALRSNSSRPTLETAWRRAYLADDWSKFQAGHPDEVLYKMLNATQLAGCITALKLAGENIRDFILLPQAVLSVPDHSVVSIRHPDLTSSQVTELIASIDNERRQLSAFVADSQLVALMDTLIG